MTNGTNISRDYADECPVHETAEKKAYTFGRYEDAEVIVYSGCSCATCHVLNDFGHSYYYNSYAAASGKAKMTVAQAASW